MAIKKSNYRQKPGWRPIFWVLFFLLAAPTFSSLAHNHEFDGHEHRDCPVYHFSAAFMSGQANCPNFEIITRITSFELNELSQLIKLNNYHSPLAQRAPPA